MWIYQCKNTFMGTKKSETIGIRVDKSLKETLGRIAGSETRSISQQVEYFVRQGIKEYLKNNPEFKEELALDKTTD